LALSEGVAQEAGGDAQVDVDNRVTARVSLALSQGVAEQAGGDAQVDVNE